MLAPSSRTTLQGEPKLRQAVGGLPDAVACPAASAAGVSDAASALQGTWQVSYTESDLIAAGADSSELGPGLGNWGHFTLTFGQGHWWIRLIGGDPAVTPNNLYYYGTYTVTGQQVTFYRHDHDYPGSDTEIWGPYTWSVYRDTLTFKKDGGGPTSLVVKPWRKTGT